MNAPISKPLQHSEIFQLMPLSPVQQPSHGHEPAGKAMPQPAGTIAGAQTTYMSEQVFAQRVVNPMGRAVARNVLLRERGISPGQKGSGNARHAAGSMADDVVDAVTGRSLTAEVSLALNLLQDGSGDDQRHHLEEQLKTRKLNQAERLHVYFEAADKADSKGLSPDAAERIKHALCQSAEDILEDILPKNRHELRQSIHDPEKLPEIIEPIAGPVDKLMTVTPRELRNRNNPDSPHTEMNRIDVPYQALSLLVFAKKKAGSKHCWTYLTALRKMTKFEGGWQMKSRQVPNRNFPKHWLAMSDASAFILAQSALAFASKLRTDIASETRIAPALPAADIGVLLLSAADGAWGKGTADQMVKDIIGPAQLDGANLAKVHLLVHDAMKLLPETAWDAKRLSARRDLLAELKSKGVGLQPAMPAHYTKEEIVEQRLQRELRGKRMSVGPKN